MSRGGAGAGGGAPTEGTVEECFICAEPVRAFCAFSCGHHTCYSCGLRIHALNDGGCPVCRVKGGEPPVVTRAVSSVEDQYSEQEMQRARSLAVVDRKLKCVIDGNELAAEVAKLYEFVCPLEGCWDRGQQEPFLELAMLKDHLNVDHKMEYCAICLAQRPAFLCEQITYGKEALHQHLDGHCAHDSPSFTGHPPCKFCSGRNINSVRFYDGEVLLKHMQQSHFTCDVCNRGQFTFTFYDNRNKLNQHFERCHKICDHPDCAGLDLMVRVFSDEVDLAIHKKRVHGVKSKLVFSPSSFGASSEAAGGATGGGGPSSTLGGGGGGGAGSPATGSNTNVIQITFDHVYRKETVEMLPTKSTNAPRARGPGGRRRQGGGNSQKEQVHAPEENGLPAYFHRAGVMEVLVRSYGTDGETARHVDCASPVAEPGTHAFGISESTASYTAKNRVPNDPREQERQLNERLGRVLTSPVLYARFRAVTKDFIDSRILTSEYYDILAKDIFPDAEVFTDVFPLLVATVPNASKKTALQEVWKMRMAPERRRESRVRAEEAKEREAEEERAQQEALWRALKSNSHKNNSSNNNGGGRGRGAAKGNAWMNPNKVSKLQQESHPSAGHTGMTSHSTAGGANNWAAHANASSQATAAQTKAPASSAGGVRAFSTAGNVWGTSSNNNQHNITASAGESSAHATASSAASYQQQLLQQQQEQQRKQNAREQATRMASSPTATLGSNLESDELYPSLPNNTVRRGANGGKKQPKKPNAWFAK